MILFAFIVGFLAILGITSVVEWTLSFLGGSRCSERRVTLIPVKEEDDGLEARLRCAYNSMRWDRFIMGGLLLIVDMGADAQTRAVCEAFAAGRGDVKIVKHAEFRDRADDEDIYKTLWCVLY